MKPISQIKIDLGLDDKGQRYFTNACYRRMNKYVPKDTGALRNSITHTVKGRTVIVGTNLKYAV